MSLQRLSSDSSPEDLANAVRQDGGAIVKNFVGSDLLARIQWAERHRPDFALKTYIQTVERTIAYFGKHVPKVSYDMLEPVARMSIILIDGLLNSWQNETDLDGLEANLDSASSALEAFADSISNSTTHA